jgi:leucyl-tRNA synthetase
MGNNSFVSMAKWPDYDAKKVDRRIIEQETFIKTLQGDTTNILHVTKMKPKRIIYYTCVDWKWKVYLTALKVAKTEAVTVRILMKNIMTDPKLQTKAKQISKYIQKLVKNIQKIPTELNEQHLETGILDEFKILTNIREFYAHIFNVKVDVFREQDVQRYDPKNRARLSEPYRPAIYVE